ncbi:hypothetical protein KAX02_02830 [candidate division WOR-3 bacterium]|nr:hypothetical protein [candidate division WOR-3 bacterium]
MNNKSLCFAIAKTEDIIWMIDNNYCKIQKTGKEQIGQAEFYVVKWDKMKELKKNIYINKNKT